MSHDHPSRSQCARLVGRLEAQYDTLRPHSARPPATATSGTTPRPLAKLRRASRRNSLIRTSRAFSEAARSNMLESRCYVASSVFACDRLEDVSEPRLASRSRTAMTAPQSSGPSEANGIMKAPRVRAPRNITGQLVLMSVRLTAALACAGHSDRETLARLQSQEPDLSEAIIDDGSIRPWRAIGNS